MRHLTLFVLLICLIPLAGAATEAEQHPGAQAYAVALSKKLHSALQAKGPNYEPRTEHLRTDGSPRFTNRLILEDSPYLIQHAHNPVDWHSWGEEAFTKAKREGKPVFLSIGYSTCHWCHVMERESFDNEAIAKLMNEMFISIKVDRERRPDVDQIYMTAVQVIAGRGGWPLSGFLTSEGKPFFATTYVPPDGFTTLLQRVDEVWRTQPDEIQDSANQIAAIVKDANSARSNASKIGKPAIDGAVEALLAIEDKELGGLGQAPKFPHEPELLLLLDTAMRTGNTAALAAAENSLQAMARGGIHDQVGGGFHRYSTDAEWLVPHFEKMLYNQAFLARAYLQAWRLTGKETYARTARQILDYVLRDMTSAEGGFYSATDADSEGREGEFFVWTHDELRTVLGEDAKLGGDVFDVDDIGNFEGKNILYLPESLEEYAERRGIAVDDLIARIDRIREKLRLAREKREHPLRDDKILTGWNGMMISAYTSAWEILGDQRYLDAATQAAKFIWEHNRTGKGELLRVHLNGSSSLPGKLDDYSYLAEALVSLFDATGDKTWLTRGEEVADGMLERFWDDVDGGFFMSADPSLIIRPKDPYDGATPSGNSVAMRTLVMLADRTGEPRYSDKAAATVSAFSETIERQPSGHSYLLVSLGEMLEGPAGPLQYGADGAIAATARMIRKDDETTLITVDLDIADGWHINSSAPYQDNLIATSVKLAGENQAAEPLSIQYPPAEDMTLAFNDKPLALYQGETRIAISLPASSETPLPEVLPVQLTLQACDNERCLLPEDIVLEIPTRTATQPGKG